MRLLQWPDNFDFDITRAINAPTSAPTGPQEDVKVPESPVNEKKRPSVTDEVVSVLSSTDLENDLDPVALNKAFNFAAWSSVVLVRRSRYLYWFSQLRTLYLSLRLL